MLTRCLHCLAPIAGGAQTLTPRLIGGSGEVIDLSWHMADCAAADPLHDDLATALCMPVEAEAREATRRAYVAIRTRTIQRLGKRAPELLRQCVIVRRDFNDIRATLRGPGLAWGLPTMRVK